MNNNEVAVMCSGGLDSFIALKVAQMKGYKAMPIFVDYGQPYKGKELEALQKNSIFPEIVKIDNYIINNVDINNWIIPGRNLLLALIGATRSERVWIMALDGEMHKFAREKDKTPEFFHLSSGIISYIFDIVRPNTIIETPFADMTKTDIVRWALDNDITEQQLRNTSSCYHDTYARCGMCGTCFKRWVAMKTTG